MIGGSELNVLVIEDLEIGQVTAHNVFKKLSCKVDIVANATRALERILMKHYDIIFIDIQLPDVDGFVLARTIRNIERRWHRIPLIAVTANSNKDLETKSKSSGFDDFMIKPLTVETVRYSLQKHLNKFKANDDG